MVPGDLIEIESHHEYVMTCDAVLLNGNCVVDESMLTGIVLKLKSIIRKIKFHLEKITE